MKTAKELLDLLQAEKIEENIFRAQSHKTYWGRVFGGQVLGQSLHAAYRTVSEEHVVHSMHAYFILPGDINLPIVYEVDRIRDGRSFVTRRVVAIQKGRPIFNMAASFQLEQEGFDHQIEMPDVPAPETLMNDYEFAKKYEKDRPELFARFSIPRPIEFRPVQQLNWAKPESAPPYRAIWIKVKGDLPDSIRTHQEVLAYASDYNLLLTAMLPHLDDIEWGSIQIASVDHAMWFHRAFRMDEWLLYSLDSPSTSNARGFTRGTIFNRQGQLVASVVQEGLLRKRRKK